jgi:hypothetical protein
MKIALILFIKDEVELLEAWLHYHAHLFGPASLFIYDNGSTDPLTLDILSGWVGRAGGIDYKYKNTDDFENRGKINVNIVRELELLGFDLFFPMDCDEFIAVDVDGQISIEFVDIYNEIFRYKDEEKILRIKYAVDNNQLNDEIFTRGPQRKCFYYKNILQEGDLGSHECKSYKYGVDHIVTNIVYIHYHYRVYEDYLRSAKNKLRPRVKEFSKEFLVNYKREKRPGFHLVDKVLQDPALYYVDQRGRLSSSANMRLISFKNFMEDRGLLSRSNSKLISYSSDEKGWRVAVDYFRNDGEFICVRGWAFNMSMIELCAMRLRLDYVITDPIRFKSIARPDVVRKHENADLWCGFEIKYPIEKIIDYEKIGCFFSSSESILGHYVELSKD